MWYFFAHTKIQKQLIEKKKKRNFLKAFPDNAFRHSNRNYSFTSEENA